MGLLGLLLFYPDPCKYIYYICADREPGMRKVYVIIHYSDSGYRFIRCFGNLKKVNNFIIKTTGRHHDYTKLTRRFKEATYYKVWRGTGMEVYLTDLE